MFPITCPLCRALLSQEAKTWRCSAGHCFDVAREGYVNLLPVQQKKSREPGDAADMVKARREFLEAGYYAPLCEAILQVLAPLGVRKLLDIGCGEGYYTAAMASAVGEVMGLDIAKPAVQLAAKRWKSVCWVVGSSAHLPLADGDAVDLVSSLFSPLPVAEVARVLRRDGWVLMVTPGAEHLREVREALFDTLVPHKPEKFVDVLEERFALVSRQDIRFPLHLNQTALKQLLLMTPYVWRAKQDKRTQLEAVENLQTAAEFTLFLFKKTA